MHTIVGEYLVAGGHRFPQTPSGPHRIPHEHKHTLCIAETRHTYWLPLVIRNALAEFPGWDLYVAAPETVLIWLTRFFPTIKTIRLDGPMGKGVQIFNNLMFNPQFWEVFETEYVLMFQCDTVFAPGAWSRLPALTKDFYGAACGLLLEDEFVINGGLSLRKVSAFKKACTLLTQDLVGLPEDVAFTKLMRAHNFNLPTLKECMAFAIESSGDPTRVIGIHGTDKQYAPAALLAATLQVKPSFPIYDLVSYDGEPILDTRLKLLKGLVDTFVVVEARYTHSGQPKQLRFDSSKYPFVKYVVIDEFPPMPPGFGANMPWVTPDSAESWWREKYQRDVAIQHIPSEPGIIICGDIDEIPDPSVLCTLTLADVEAPIHLDMAFLVHTSEWVKQEQWTRAFVCSSVKPPESLTEERCKMSNRVLPNAGWHCSSFFDVESQIRKIQNFAHREFSREIDPETIRQRFAAGKDPYGRTGPQFDCVSSKQYRWLDFV